MALVFHYVFGRACGVLGFDYFQSWMVGQKLVALHQCYGMGMHFMDCRPVVFGQATDRVLYVQLMLADYRYARLAQQLIVVQQAACYRVLDGHHAYDCRIGLYGTEDILECGAADELNLLAVEILSGRNVVE